MLEIVSSSRFKKDLKNFEYNKDVKTKLNEVLALLIKKAKLPEKNRDHALINDYKGYRECHIMPDVLLVYKVDENSLYLARIGSHSEIF